MTAPRSDTAALTTTVTKFLLADSRQAPELWESCKRLHILQNLDAPGVKRLTPMLYTRVAELGDSNQTIDTLKEVFARCWRLTSEHAVQYRSVLQVLQNADIEVVLIKGAALIAGGYVESSERFMHDIDVVVGLDQLERCRLALNNAGWVSERPIFARTIEFTHGLAFHHPSGAAIDAHWHTLWEAPRQEISKLFAENTEEASFLERPVRILNPTALFFYVCVHGTQSPSELYWAIDAASILRKHTLDTRLLSELTSRCCVRDKLDRALRQLQALGVSEIPPAVFENLARTERTFVERIEKFVASNPNSPLGGLPNHVARWLRADQNPWSFRKLWKFIRLLKLQWKLKAWRELPEKLLSTSQRVLRRWYRQ